MFAIRLARIPRFRANLGEARSAGLRQAPGNRSFGPPPARPRHSKSRTFRNAASPSASRSSTRQRSTTPPSHARDRSYFVRKTGSNGFRIGYQPTMKKVVSDWRASLDEGTEVKNRRKQFRRIATRYEKTARACLNAMHRSRKALRLETNLLWTWSAFEMGI
jgi:hypothetical protein